MVTDGASLEGLASLRPASTDRLSEQVSAQIADAILSGTLQPGERLVEAEIAASLHVSKSPVREALRDLSAQGLVTIHPRRGAYVRSLTVKDLRDINVLRATLETLAIRLGIERRDDRWIEDLRAGITAMRRAADNAEGNRQHMAFHRLLISRCDNSRVLEALDAISVQTQSFIAIVGRLYGNPDAVAADHQALIDLVVAGDTTQVERVVESHILDTEQELEERWRARQETVQGQAAERR